MDDDGLLLPRGPLRRSRVRGGGVGRALIAHVRAWAEQHGSAKLYWLTAESNTTARGLYDRVASRSGMIHYEIDLD
ncbi:GNAT family N-acetyltransferase [Microbacterium maritypicum]|uniref:GNAT family N-acetyltransferase n=1 Tax=Microbacterium maritypicum TaxID=33918 RepID=UPI0022E313B3|nr:GNAT family N-acetyltransferase [Microbacterium liquefaciens]